MYICSNTFYCWEYCNFILHCLVYDVFHILYIRSTEINTLIDWLIESLLLEHFKSTHQDSHIFTVGASMWLIIATFLKLPVSTTHSVVGATIGFTLVCRGDEGLNWESFGLIGRCSVVCWFNNSVSGSGHVALNIKMAGAKWTGENEEGIGHSIRKSVLAFIWRAGGNLAKLKLISVLAAV